MREYILPMVKFNNNAISVSITINLPRGNKNHGNLEFWRTYSLKNLYKHSSNINYKFFKTS